MPQRLVVVDHPVLADRLTVMRDKSTGYSEFRQALFEASAILAVEAARELPVSTVEIETPLEATAGSRLPAEIAIVPVLRAGLGMVDGFLRLLPGARVGHVGVYRDEQEHRPVDYYERLPPGLTDSYVYVVDPMLATGGSAVHALERIKRDASGRLRFVCLVAAPEGLRALREAHPEVPIWCAAIDRSLDERGYIRPGLGDAGDRIFGTE
jgi:uracil phosphoribosyltransferase